MFLSCRSVTKIVFPSISMIPPVAHLRRKTEVTDIGALLGELFAEHREAALRLLARRLVLNHVPMFDEDSVLDEKNVCCNPVHRKTKVRKSSMHDDEISFRQNCSRLISESRWQALDEIEQSFTARCDMSAVLNIVRRPVTLGCSIVPLVE